jgi:hypothetical protein
MATGTVAGQTYKKITVVAALGDTWTISPFDINGNVVSEMVIACDTTVGKLTLKLPNIATLNNQWNTKITVIALTGATNDVDISAFVQVVPVIITNQIGSATTLTLSADGQTAELNVAEDLTWYGVATL